MANNEEYMFQTSLNNKVHFRTRARIGTDPTGSITITENGEHDVKDYAAAVVNVPQTEESPLAVTPTKSEQVFEAEELHAYNPVTVHAIPPEYIIPTGQKEITENGTHDVSQYDTAAVNVLPVMQEKTVTPQKTAQTAEPDAGKDGLSRVYVAAIPEYFRRMPALSSKNRTAAWFNSATIGSTQAIRLLNADEAPEIGEAITIQPTITAYNEGQNAGACITGTVTSIDTTNGVLVNITVTDKYIDLIPSGTLNVTDNGVYNTKGKEAVNVTVQPTLQSKAVMPSAQQQVIIPDAGYYGLDQVTVGAADDLGAFLDGSVDRVYNDQITSVVNYGFYARLKLQYVELQNCVTLGDRAFSLCFDNSGVYNNKVLRLPSVTTIGEWCFNLCYADEIYLPALVTATASNATKRLGASAQKLRLPSLTALNGATTGGLTDLTKLVSLDIAVPAIDNYIKSTSTLFKLLAMRHSTVATLAITSLYSSCPLRAGTGYVLVPRALISSYETATNWSSLAAAGTQFLALEDYTQDGTTTGELDEDKIDALLA